MEASSDPRILLVCRKYKVGLDQVEANNGGSILVVSCKSQEFNSLLGSSLSPWLLYALFSPTTNVEAKRHH